MEKEGWVEGLGVVGRMERGGGVVEWVRYFQVG